MKLRSPTLVRSLAEKRAIRSFRAAKKPNASVSLADRINGESTRFQTQLARRQRILYPRLLGGSPPGLISTTHKESRSRLQTLAACLLGFALIGGGIFFWRQASGPSASTPLNVLIVLVGTLRADHLGHHGYPRDTSPRIDQFAENATTFMNHYSQAPRTGPAVASLFTGLHPLSHGAINPLSRWNAMGTLAGEKTTLAEILEGPDMRIMEPSEI